MEELLDLRVRHDLLHGLTDVLVEKPILVFYTEILECRGPVDAGHLQGGVEQVQRSVVLLEDSDRGVIIPEEKLHRLQQMAHAGVGRGVWILSAPVVHLVQVGLQQKPGSFGERARVGIMDKKRKSGCEWIRARTMNGAPKRLGCQ